MCHLSKEYLLNLLSIRRGVLIYAVHCMCARKCHIWCKKNDIADENCTYSLSLFELHKKRHVTPENSLAIYCCCQELFSAEGLHLMNLLQKSNKSIHRFWF